MDAAHDEDWMLDGHCWICGSVADSAEHIAKKSDLKANWGNGPFLIHIGGEPPIKVPGPKSDLVKYRRTLCQHCNNSRTQQADLAWDEFKSRVQPLAQRKAAGGAVYLPKLFSKARWKRVMLGVHLYWVKALGCFLVDHDERRRVAELRSALLEERPCEVMQLVFWTVPTGNEPWLHRTTLNVWERIDAAYFMYSFNRICVAPVLMPRGRPLKGRFMPWHPNSPTRFIHLNPIELPEFQGRKA